MTLAVAVKVFDGVVLAADSATTFNLTGGSHQVYNNANKVFQLHREKPIGLITWGLGQIGPASIATLAKDLRVRLMGKDPVNKWKLTNTYTIEAVAKRVVEMMHGELYATQFAGTPAPHPVLGFIVAGYSAGEAKSEAWEIMITDPATPPVLTEKFGKDQAGWTASGQPEATSRLWNGCDPELAAAVRAAVAGTPQEATVEQAITDAGRSAVHAAMPFADAINLATYIVETTVGFIRYSHGPDSVGGQIEVAGISRHEGFKWISRKHYYPASLNPEDPH